MDSTISQKRISESMNGQLFQLSYLEYVKARMPVKEVREESMRRGVDDILDMLEGSGTLGVCSSTNVMVEVAEILHERGADAVVAVWQPEHQHPTTITTISITHILQQKPSSLILLDISRQHQHSYCPYLSSVLKLGNTIIFYAPAQQQILSRDHPELLLVDCQIAHPFESETNLTAQELEKKLVSFVQEQKQRQNKMNVVIFHPPTPTYIAHLQHLFRLEAVAAYANIIPAYSHQKIKYNDDCVNVIVCENTQQLQAPLKNLYFIFDYGEDSAHYFKYENCVYVREEGYACVDQISRRVQMVRGTYGQYCGVGQVEHQGVDNWKKGTDVGWYVLKMIYYNGEIDVRASYVKDCVQCLEERGIIKQICKLHDTVWQYQLLKPQLLKFQTPLTTPLHINTYLNLLNQSLSPETILYHQHLLILVCAMHSTLPTLYTQSQEEKVDNTVPQLFVGVDEQSEKKELTLNWRKSGGYGYGCVDIMVRYLVLERKKLQVDNEEVGVGEFFRADELEEMFGFQLTVLKQMLNKYEEIKKCVRLDDYVWAGQVESEDWGEVLGYMMEGIPRSVYHYSGSRRLGYYNKHSKEAILASNTCLLSVLNEVPNTVYVLEVSSSNQISKCCYIEDEQLISVYGMLPTLSKQSFGEAEIEFHQISSATYRQLMKFSTLSIFEKEHECSIQCIQQLGTITIQCGKQHRYKVEEEFSKLLETTRNMFNNQSSVIQHSSTLKIMMGAGGQIEQLKVKQPDQEELFFNIGIVSNLHEDVEIEDLKELFDEFFQVKDIIMQKHENTNKAILYFTSHKDYRKLYSYFNGCCLYGKPMLVEPYKNIPERIQEDAYLLFEWNSWVSTGEASVEFMYEKDADKAFEDLMKNPEVDGCSVVMSRKKKKLFLSGMRPETDEKYLESVLAVYGRVHEISVHRYQTTKLSKVQEHEYPIHVLINEAFKGENLKYRSDPIHKGKNGYRSQKVRFDHETEMKEVYFVLNDITGRLGNSRLYATPYYTYPIQISINDRYYVQVYVDILQEIAEQLQRPKPFQISYQPKVTTIHLIISTPTQDEIQIVQTMLVDRLKAREMNIYIEDHALLLSDFMKNHFKKLEKEYKCRFNVDIFHKKLEVMSRQNVYFLLEKQINSFLKRDQTYRIQLHHKAFQYLKQHPEQYEKVSEKLSFINFQRITKSILLKGTVENLQFAKSYLSNILPSIGKKQIENMDLENVCDICCEEAMNPFTLENCGHKFCYECLQMYIKTVMKDLSLYPIKCPHCQKKVFICDLNALLNEKDWNDIVKVSINCFVYRNPDKYTFCYTPRCPQINKIQGEWFRCRECKKGYCLSCKGQYHPGMTCEEARYGSDRLLDEYLLKNSGRKCANKKCNAVIVRISGCYKVTCTRCGKSMCFKCQQRNMVAYDTCNQAYAHMDKEHGGCF